MVLAAFGLSAFFFSTLSAWLFPGNTDGFLLLLAVATSGITALGFLFCVIVPQGGVGYGYRAVGSEDGARLRRTRSEEERAELKGRRVEQGMSSSATAARFGSSSSAAAGDVDERSSLFSGSEEGEEGRVVGGEVGVDVDGVALVADIRGWELMRNTDFWYLFGIMGCLAGCGLMTIKYLPPFSPLSRFVC